MLLTETAAGQIQVSRRLLLLAGGLRNGMRKKLNTIEKFISLTSSITFKINPINVKNNEETQQTFSLWIIVSLDKILYILFLFCDVRKCNFFCKTLKSWLVKRFQSTWTYSKSVSPTVPSMGKSPLSSFALFRHQITFALSCHFHCWRSSFMDSHLMV